jgi:two-component system chemotaxis response regulator CheY
MKALIVDDSPTIRRILVRSLALAGICETAEACDGVEALGAIRGQRFTLILLNWNMPRLDGLGVLRALRQSGDHTPVIMVTSEAEKSRVIEAIRCGANDYLIKPFSPEQLAEKVRHLLSLTTGTP